MNQIQGQQTAHSHVHSSSQTEGHPCCLHRCFDSRGLCFPSLSLKSRSCCTFLIHPMRHPFHDAQKIHLHSHLCTNRPCTAVCPLRALPQSPAVILCIVPITVSKAWLSTLHKAVRLAVVQLKN